LPSPPSTFSRSRLLYTPFRGCNHRIQTFGYPAEGRRILAPFSLGRRVGDKGGKD
jgi:hypothetical protein